MGHRAENARRPRKRWLHRVFTAGIAMKGAFAAVEILAGAALLLFGPQAAAFADAVSTGGATLHPRPLAACLTHLAAGFSPGGGHFYALFFLAHGLVKGLAVVALLLRAPYAFPFAVSVLSAFVVYQVHHALQTGSMVLFLISALDVLIICLIVREYRPAPLGGT